MSEHRTRLKMSEPARYQIKVQGRLDETWAEYFSGMRLTAPPDNGITCLEGVVPDQAALFGLLLQIRDLGLPLLFVKWLESG